MKTSSLQFKVLLIAAAAMVLSAAVSITALYRVDGTTVDLDRISREDFQVQQGILRSGLALERQVQEWRHVLLTGRDAAATEKAWAAFQKHEKEAVDLAREARSGTSHDDIRKLLEEFIAAHKQAGGAY